MGSLGYSKYNIDSCYIYYSRAVKETEKLDSKSQTELCVDFKLCLSRSLFVKDSIANIAFPSYKSQNSIEKMKQFNKLYEGTLSIEFSTIFIEELYFKNTQEANNSKAYVDFLTMYPNSNKKEIATSKIHEFEFQRVNLLNNKSDFQNYIVAYPKSIFCKEVRQKIEGIDYENLKISKSLTEYEEFIKNYPNSINLNEVLELFETPFYEQTISKRDITSLNIFKIRYPTSIRLNTINEIICEISFEEVKKLNTLVSFKQFVKLFPNSKFEAEAQKKISELFPIVPKLLANGKYIYIDKFSGKTLINSVYDKASLFENNQAIVMQNGKYGVIDESGKTIVPINFDDVSKSGDPDLYLVTLNEREVFYNNEGKKVLDTDYDEVPYFSNGLAIVSKGNDLDNSKLGVYSIINSNFQELIPFKCDYIESVADNTNLFFFNIGGEGFSIPGHGVYPYSGKWGVINENGKILIPAIFDQIDYLDSPNHNQKKHLFIANRGRKMDTGEDPSIPGTCGLIDINGNEIIPFEYQDISYGGEDKLIVNKGGDLTFDYFIGPWPYIDGGKWGVIDYSNKVKVPIIYDDLIFKEKNYIIQKGAKLNDSGNKYLGGKYGVVSGENHIIIPLKYDFIVPYTSGPFCIFSMGCKVITSLKSASENNADGGKWGLTDLNGKIILPANFSEVSITNDTNLVLLSTGKLFGLSDLSGKLILPIKFDEINVTSNFIFAKTGTKYQIYNKQGLLFSDKKYDAFSSLNNNFISFRIGEKNGILRPDGNELFSAKFWATKNEEDGYEQDIELEGSYFKIKESGSYFYATETGEVFRE
jgi:outer membrane protein assembly factor BamD (BamD/ComL family)